MVARVATEALAEAPCKNATDKLFPSAAKQVFIKRFQRWDHLLDGAVERAAERAELLLEKISNKVPQAVLAAWMHTALNGWCTARRFQTQGPCRLFRYLPR